MTLDKYRKKYKKATKKLLHQLRFEDDIPPGFIGDLSQTGKEIWEAGWSSGRIAGFDDGYKSGQLSGQIQCREDSIFLEEAITDYYTGDAEPYIKILFPEDKR